MREFFELIIHNLKDSLPSSTRNRSKQERKEENQSVKFVFLVDYGERRSPGLKTYDPKSQTKEETEDEEGKPQTYFRNPKRSFFFFFFSLAFKALCPLVNGGWQWNDLYSASVVRKSFHIRRTSFSRDMIWWLMKKMNGRVHYGFVGEWLQFYFLLLFFSFFPFW